ncbi:MAG: hypothetical protein M3P93_03130 [Actinomycetota bacterium]|nr:hypothetical protein [Actinomycetota bacterium]
MRLHVVLEPAAGDGFLTEQDALRACQGLPGDSPVLLILSDMDSFSGQAAGWVGRRFAGTGYLIEARPSAWGPAGDFADAVRRSEDDYLAITAADLRRDVS